jgi:2-polyprenyl-3-methyl-5-hydroxy-6-metoxy-1,4-benzoquinol methylase
MSTEDNTIYRERSYDNQGFPELVDLVGTQPCRVLDIGCGCGANLQLLRKRGHEATGLTLSETEARIVEEQGLSCCVWDITSEGLPFPRESFDALVFCHVLEHLAWPEIVLQRYTQLLKPMGKVFVVLPNAMQFMQRWQFLMGRFRYTKIGIMDSTHLRFFDFHTARQLVASVGLKVLQHFGLGKFPMGPFREWLPGFSMRVDQYFSVRWPGLIGFHLIVVGQLSPIE